MGNRCGVADVRRALEEAVAEDPGCADRRAGGGLQPRYLDGGRPACLVGVVLARLGASTGQLRALDREQVRLEHSRHPLRARYTREAWALLAYLQRCNDDRATWAEAFREAFAPDWRGRYPGPWCG